MERFRDGATPLQYEPSLHGKLLPLLASQRIGLSLYSCGYFFRGG
jgi:hypothetical protein